MLMFPTWMTFAELVMWLVMGHYCSGVGWCVWKHITLLLKTHRSRVCQIHEHKTWLDWLIKPCLEWLVWKQPVGWGETDSLSTLAINDLFDQPHMIGERNGGFDCARAGRETEGENLLHGHCVCHKSHVNWPAVEPRPSHWKASDEL
jgi:hypothetical protein